MFFSAKGIVNFEFLVDFSACYVSGVRVSESENLDRANGRGRFGSQTAADTATLGA